MGEYALESARLRTKILVLHLIMTTLIFTTLELTIRFIFVTLANGTSGSGEILFLFLSQMPKLEYLESRIKKVSMCFI